MPSLPTSLILLGLVAAWLIVLVPMVSKRREHVPESDEDSAGFRVLRRAGAALRRRPVLSRTAHRMDASDDEYRRDDRDSARDDDEYRYDDADSDENSDGFADDYDDEYAHEYAGDHGDEHGDDQDIAGDRESGSDDYVGDVRAEDLESEDGDNRYGDDRYGDDRYGDMATGGGADRDDSVDRQVNRQVARMRVPEPEQDEHVRDAADEWDEVHRYEDERRRNDSQRDREEYPRRYRDDDDYVGRDDDLDRARDRDRDWGRDRNWDRGQSQDWDRDRDGDWDDVMDRADPRQYRRAPLRPGRGGFDPQAAARAKEYRYRQRRRIALVLLALTAIGAAIGWVGVTMAWAAAGVTGVLLVLYLAYLRRQVRIEESIRMRRAARLERARQIRPSYHASVAEQVRAYRTGETPRPGTGGDYRVVSHARPGVPPQYQTRGVPVDLDDDDPAFDDLEYYEPMPYRRAAGQ